MSLIYYQDMISSGILLSAAFILLCLFTHSKPSMTVINTMSRSRRGTVTPAATGDVIELCVVGGKDGLMTVAATDELNEDTLVGTAKQKRT